MDFFNEYKRINMKFLVVFFFMGFGVMWDYCLGVKFINFYILKWCVEWCFSILVWEVVNVYFSISDK